MYMHNGKKHSQPAAVGFGSVPERSLENPKPDPHDMSISTWEYESRVKAFDKIERLARHQHNVWIYGTTNILRVMDEQIQTIIDLNNVLLKTNGYEVSPSHRQVEKLLKEYSERDQRWATERCSFSKLPFDRKERFRYDARRAYEAMNKK